MLLDIIYHQEMQIKTQLDNTLYSVEWQKLKLDNKYGGLWEIVTLHNCTGMQNFTTNFQNILVVQAITYIITL